MFASDLMELILHRIEICSRLPFLPFQEFETNSLPLTPTTNLHGLVSTTSIRIHRFIGFREDV